jgi:5-formyltetrahydrofolate cyclo-ligase
MAALHAAGARICVPVIAGAGRPLDFREWPPGCAMVEGPFKAMVPESGDWLTPDALIVPLVGFDAGRSTGWAMAAGSMTGHWRGWRAGGGGSIGFAFAAQELRAGNSSRLNQRTSRLDAIVTEQGCLERLA